MITARPTPRPLLHACGLALCLLALPACNDTVPAPEAATNTAPAPSDITYAFAIEGMHCDGCVASITQGVKELPGVRDVQVSLDDERATVRVAEDGSAPDAIIAAIDQRGYDAKPLN